MESNYETDLVSIIMPAFNCGRFVKESIQSVLSQSYENWELLIVNDCSTDNSLEIISSFLDPRITVISNSDNLGVAETRNVAITAARGQYIAFLDSDDIWLEGKLKRQLAELNANENAICCHTSFQRIDEFGNNIGVVYAVEHVDFKLMLKGNFIGNLSAILDRSKVDIVIRQKNIKHEDYLMWLEILQFDHENYSIGIKDVYAKYRVHTKSISANKLKSMKWHWDILRGQLKLSLLSSIVNIFYYVYFAVQKRS